MPQLRVTVYSSNNVWLVLKQWNSSACEICTVLMLSELLKLSTAEICSNLVKLETRNSTATLGTLNSNI